MYRIQKALTWTVASASFLTLVAGLALFTWPLVLIGIVGLVLAALSQALWRGRHDRPGASSPQHAAAPHYSESEALVRQLLEQGREALLLRPEIIGDLEPGEQQLAADALNRKMALVPAGEVVVGEVDEAIQAGAITRDDLPKYFARPVMVQAMLIDRFPVTNRLYQYFLDDGGYDALALWDEEVWPVMNDFVDRTGKPGPKYWRDGRYPGGQDDHPVVGISWFEASALARWVGKRLVDDAEWVKAGCWPIVPRPGVWLERKYPWGNSFDTRRANLWASGIGHTVGVHEFGEGASMAGVEQLIGNVWEWTASNFGFASDSTLRLTTPMKSIRGGAFDTYFEAQATCHFQSGENPLSRKHNIGVRLAVGLADLAPHIARQLTGAPAEPASLEETPS